eukprot:2726953-Rhodomonas_salina.1
MSLANVVRQSKKPPTPPIVNHSRRRGLERLESLKSKSATPSTVMYDGNGQIQRRESSVYGNGQTQRSRKSSIYGNEQTQRRKSSIYGNEQTQRRKSSSVQNVTPRHDYHDSTYDHDGGDIERSLLTSNGHATTYKQSANQGLGSTERQSAKRMLTSTEWGGDDKNLEETIRILFDN